MNWYGKVSFIACVTLWMTSTTGLRAAPDDGPRKPNILFIAVDDLRCELGCYGVKEIKSPNIDRLAARGVTFARAYCQMAVCNPSRASMLTGLRPDTVKVWDLVTPLRTTVPDVVTLPQYFKLNGYYTVGMGKIFHNSFPDPASWTIPDQPVPAPTKEYSPAVLQDLQRQREEASQRGMTADQISNRVRGPATDIEEVPDNRRFDGALGDLALAELRKAAAGKTPFFLAVGFIRPHLPFTPPRKYWDLYDPEKIPLAGNPYLPAGMPAVAFGGKSMGGMYELRDCMDFRNAPSPFQGSLTVAEQRRLRHGYYASVSFMDVQVGRVLDELDRLGLRDNTIVILWGDHGWKLGEHDAWCKHSNSENDTNTALLLSVPGMKNAGAKTNSLVEFVDIYPTLADLAGLSLPKHLEGVSFRPLLDDPSLPWKSAAFSQYPRSAGKSEIGQLMGYAMRTERYRFVVWVARDDHAKVDAIELYDHTVDPQENTNIAKTPGNNELVDKLLAQWRQGWQGAKPGVAAKL